MAATRNSRHWYGLKTQALLRRDTFNDDGAIIGAFEAMFGCGLIGWTAVPSFCLLESRKFQHHHTLTIRAFDNLLATMRDAESDRMTCKAGRGHITVQIDLPLIAGSLFDEDDIGDHNALLYPADCFDCATSHASCTFTRSDISRSFEVTPAAAVYE